MREPRSSGSLRNLNVQSTLKMRSRRLLIAAALVVLAAGGAALISWRPETAISRANYERLKLGVGREEVQAVLGPPRNESTGPLVANLWPRGPIDVREACLTEWACDVSLTHDLPEEWVSDNVIIRLTFDSAGRVVAKSAIEVRRKAEGPLDRVRRWLRL
jgi:hypothetical protein